MVSCYAMFQLCLFQLRLISSHLTRKFKRGSDNLSKWIPLNVPEVMKLSDSGQTLPTSGSGYVQVMSL